jgi:hypothetical protein
MGAGSITYSGARNGVGGVSPMLSDICRRSTTTNRHAVDAFLPTLNLMPGRIFMLLRKRNPIRLLDGKSARYERALASAHAKKKSHAKQTSPRLPPSPRLWRTSRRPGTQRRKGLGFNLCFLSWRLCVRFSSVCTGVLACISQVFQKLGDTG